jgi:hypothetical protein
VLGGLVAAGLGLSAAAFVACGDTNGLLANEQAGQLSDTLDAVSVAVEGGRCASAVRQAAELQDALDKLPSTVDAKLRRSLQEGAATVAARAQNDCRPGTTTKAKTTPKTDTGPVTTETLPTTTTTAPTTPTTPTTTTPPTTPTTPTTTTPPTTPTTPTNPGGPDSGGGGGGTGSGGAGGAGQ